MLEQLTNTQILLGLCVLFGISYAVVTALNGDIAPRSKPRRQQLTGSGMLDAIGVAHLEEAATAIADIGVHPQPDFFRPDRRDVTALHARSKAA